MGIIPFTLGGPPVVTTTSAPKAAGIYDTERLISSVRLRGLLKPADDGTTFPTDDDILNLANEEMVSFLVPWILEAREGHFIQSVDIPLVSGQQLYTIPARAVGDDVSSVKMVDSSGNVVGDLVQEDLEVATRDSFAGGGVYFFQNNQIGLVPTPQGESQSLRIYYPQRPNQIVPSTSTVAITSTAQLTGQYSVGYVALPTTGPTWTAGVEYECVHSQPGFEVVPLGVASSAAATVAVFPGTLPDQVNVGDSLCLQDTANYLTYIPADMVWIFAQWLALRIAEFKGDGDKIEQASKGFGAMETRVRKFLGKREELGHRKVSVANARGRFRSPFRSP